MCTQALKAAIEWAERKLSQSHSIAEWDELDHVRTLLAAARQSAPEHEKLIADIDKEIACWPQEALDRTEYGQQITSLLRRCRTALSADTKTIKGDLSCGSDDHAAAFPSASRPDAYAEAVDAMKRIANDLQTTIRNLHSAVEGK